MQLAGRGYRHDDLARVTALLETRLAAGAAWHLSVAELRQVLPRPAVDSEHNGRVWEDGAGVPVGFALVWPPTYSVYLLLAPAHDPERSGDRRLVDLMLAWLAERAGEIARERRAPVTLQVRASDRDTCLLGFLERRGYAREAWSTVAYRRALADPVPAPSVPDGFAVRHVRGEEEAETCAALHREAFGTPHMQAADRVAFMRDPGYIPELDLIAVAPDGGLAAFVRAGIDREISRHTGTVTGFTDPVGTHPAYRKRGLARALLCEAFRRLQHRGVQLTLVSTGSWNVPMQRLAESVGYEMDHHILTCARTFP